MAFNSDLLAGMDRQEEDLSGIPVYHHPVHGAAPFPPPTEQVITGPIDFTEFHQPQNIDDLFAGLDDIGEVNLPIVDKRLFDNIALASIFPLTENPAPIIRAALSSELSTSFFRLVQCSQASALVIFRTPHLCLIATNMSQLEIEWEGVDYVVSIVPHDMTDNRIQLDQGFLVNLEVLDFPVEYWCKELIAAAFYPFGLVIIIEQLCLTGSDFSAISLCLNIKQAWLPRRILINAGPEGIMLRVRIKGYVNLNNASLPPSPPAPPSPIHHPMPNHSDPHNANLDIPLQRAPSASLHAGNVQSRLSTSPVHRTRASPRAQSTPLGLEQMGLLTLHLILLIS
jgi:hypothetical protein